MCWIFFHYFICTYLIKVITISQSDGFTTSPLAFLTFLGHDKEIAVIVNDVIVYVNTCVHCHEDTDLMKSAVVAMSICAVQYIFCTYSITYAL